MYWLFHLKLARPAEEAVPQVGQHFDSTHGACRVPSPRRVIANSTSERAAPTRTSCVLDVTRVIALSCCSRFALSSIEGPAVCSGWLSQCSKQWLQDRLAFPDEICGACGDIIQSRLLCAYLHIRSKWHTIPAALRYCDG